MHHRPAPHVLVGSLELAMIWLPHIAAKREPCPMQQQKVGGSGLYRLQTHCLM